MKRLRQHQFPTRQFLNPLLKVRRPHLQLQVHRIFLLLPRVILHHSRRLLMSHFAEKTPPCIFSLSIFFQPFQYPLPYLSQILFRQH